ncbi:MAG: toxin-antitoxin system YwqK family antitoxin [Bacteroidota bacterium]
MKYLLATIALILSLNLHSQDFKNKEYYPGGQLKAEFNGKKNAADGLVKVYYESGSLQGILNYKKGVQDGKSVLYHENGNVYKEYFYKDGIQEDTMKIYYDNGALKELSIIKNKEKNGIFKSYFDNGQLEIDGFAKDGVAHGFCTFYKKNGDVWKSGELNMGTPVGEWTVHDKAGVTVKSYDSKKELDCDQLKIGNFILRDPAIPGSTVIVRDQKSQTEVNKTINLRMKYKVNWTDKCVYQLSNPKLQSNNKDVAINKAEVLTVRIFETNEKGYTALITSSVSELRRTIHIDIDNN